MDHLAQFGIKPERHDFEPLSEIDVVCKDERIPKAYDRVHKHLYIDAIAMTKKLRGTKVFHQQKLKPKKGPDDVLDFRWPRGRGGTTHTVHCKQGEAKLFLPVGLVYRYLPTGIQVCEGVYVEESLLNLRQALVLPGGFDDLGPARDAHNRYGLYTLLQPLKPLIKSDMTLIEVAGMLVTFPDTLPPPKIVENCVCFLVDGCEILYKNLILQPPKNYDVLFAYNDVFVFPEEVNMFNLFPLKGKIERYKCNRIGLVNMAGTEDYVIPVMQSDGEEEEEEEELSVADTDQSTEQLPAVAPADTASTNRSGTAPVQPSTGSSVIAPVQHRALEENSSALPAAIVLGNTKTPLFIVKIGFVEFPGADPVFFPHNIDIFALPFAIQFGDGLGGSHQINQTLGNILIHFPTGFIIGPGPRGLEIMSKDASETKMAHATAEDVPHSIVGPVFNDAPAGNAEDVLGGNKVVLLGAPYPEAVIEIAGIKFWHPAHVVPVQTDNTTKFPGGLLRTFKFTGKDGVMGKLVLGDDWTILIDRKGRYKIFRESFPGMAADKEPLVPINKEIKQQFAHCGRCPRINTTYEEDRCVIQDGEDFLWLWFPPVFHPKLDNSDGPPKVLFPRSEAHFTIKGVEIHYPPNFDIIFTHEIHFYPKSARVIERYQKDRDERFFSPKPPQLLGDIFTVGNARLVKLAIDPEQREALFKEMRDWTARHKPKALEVYRKAEDLALYDHKNSKDGTLMRRVYSRVRQKVEEVEAQGLDNIAEKMELMDHILDIWSEEYLAELDKAKQRGEVSEEMQAIIDHDKKWMAQRDESFQIMMDNIERLRLERDNDKKKSDEEVANNVNDYINDLFKKTGIPVENEELGDVPRSSDYVYTGYDNVPLYKTKATTSPVIHPGTQRAVRLNEAANNFLEGIIGEILGRKPAAPSLREDAKPLWM